jgi:hypothetical protein
MQNIAYSTFGLPSAIELGYLVEVADCECAAGNERKEKSLDEA